MAHTIDTTGFTAMQIAAFDKADDIALAYNGALFHEIGADDFRRLRAADPADLTDSDLCDANMVMLSALQVVLGLTEDEAMTEIVGPTPEIVDYVWEIADEQRETRSFASRG